MSGLILLLAVALWMVACGAITRWAARSIPSFFKVPTGLLLFCALFVAPIADELLALRQFDRLCQQAVVPVIDAERIKGKSVEFQVVASDEHLTGTWIPIRHSRYRLVEAGSDVELGAYEAYTADGGILSRLSSVPEGGRPWLISPARCSPPLSARAMAIQYSFDLIN
jgi:hypothetical protein